MDLVDILLLVDAESAQAESYAVALAAASHAHLTAATFVYDLSSLLALSDASLALVATARAEAGRFADSIAARALARAREANVSAVGERILAGAGDLETAASALMRRFDLTIIEQPAPNGPSERATLISAALLGSGRPTLVVPFVQTDMRMDRILVAWDGSGHAARALSDAMPWLQRAKAVEVVTVGSAAKTAPSADAGLAAHLARRGIHAEIKSLSSAGDVASTLLSYAFDRSSDLLVMGAYGHSRLRESMLGGATRSILDSMTLPVLMAH